MNYKIFRSLTLVLVVVGACSLTVSCNTTKGVGRDVERAGEGLQDAVDGAKR